MVESFARRLQVQERPDGAGQRDCIPEALNPMGVAVVIKPAIYVCRCGASTGFSHDFTAFSGYSSRCPFARGS